MEIITKSPGETKRKGIYLGEKIKKETRTVIIALKGGLGTGKTTFLQGLAKGMGVKEDVNSPTFLIYKKYKIEKKGNFYHFDAYRITERDLDNLDFEKIIERKGNVIAIEWSENIKKRLPKEAVKIRFLMRGENERRLIIEGNSGIIGDSFYEKSKKKKNPLK